jgi:hypothetical protein
MHEGLDSTVAVAAVAWTAFLMIIVARLLPVALTAEKMPHSDTVIFSYFLYVFRMLA